jgi:hypothetical protein
MFFRQPKVEEFYESIKAFVNKNFKGRKVDIPRIVVIIDSSLKDRYTFDALKHDMYLFGLTKTKLVYKIKEIGKYEVKIIFVCKRKKN